jgi:hypothetical protein
LNEDQYFVAYAFLKPVFIKNYPNCYKVQIMKYKVLLSILASALLFGEVFAEEMDAEKVKFMSATNTLVIPEVHIMDESGNMMGMKSVELVLIKGDEPYQFEVVKLEDAAEKDDHGCVAPQVWHGEMGHCMAP